MNEKCRRTANAQIILTRIIMKDKTKQEYLSIANHFIRRHFESPNDVTPKKLTDALIRSAQSYRPNYWRRLKCALKYHQRDYPKALERLEKLKNPIWTRDGKRFIPKPGLTVKPKQKRLKSSTKEDFGKFWELFAKRGDYDALYALVLVRYLGVRPSEMTTIKFDGDRVFIQGSKKNKSGDRGQDRWVSIGDLNEDIVSFMRNAVDALSHKKPSEIKSIGERVRRASRRLFPRRKTHYSFYTWRHQMGSNLKASGMTRKEIAYVMGHQSTASIEQYGNKRSGSGKIYARPADPIGVEKVRETHRNIPTKTNTVIYPDSTNSVTLR